MERLKNIGIGILAILVLLVILFAEHAVTATYTRTATVIYVSGSRVTCKDAGNRVWEFCDTGQVYTQYETVKLRMRTNGTEYDVTDDDIVKVNGHTLDRVGRYAGQK